MCSDKRVLITRGEPLKDYLKKLKGVEKRLSNLELRVLLLGKAISPRLESLLGTRIAELNGVLTSPKELDGRIAVNLVLLAERLLSSAIDFSDSVRSILVGSGELLPSRSKTLAVTAPWGEELHSKGLLGKLSIEILTGERKNSTLRLLFLLFLRLLFLRLLLLRLLLLLLLGLTSLQIIVDVLQVRVNSTRDTDILRSSTISEELDGRIATDTKAAAKILVSSAIDFTDLELILSLSGELDPSRSETLAVTTPWGKELNEPETLLDCLIKVIGGKDDNL